MAYKDKDKQKEYAYRYWRAANHTKNNKYEIEHA